MKIAHDTTNEWHSVNYRSNARFAPDLENFNRYYVFQFRGRIGWFKSKAFLDQVPLWQEGCYVDMLLSIEMVRTTFAHKTRLGP